MLHTPPEDEILELREIAHNFNERGKEENYLWLMALSDRLQGYRARVAELEAFIIRNSDPYDMNDPDAETFHEIGKRLVPQNY